MAIATGTALALAAMGASAGTSAYSAKKQADMAKQAATLSPAGQQAQQGLVQQAGRLNTMGDRLLGQGTNDLERVAQYYRPLLAGDRAQVGQAIAPDVAAVTDVYRGAERSLDRSGVRGAQREQQAGELRRQKAGQIALMPMQQRGRAAEALAGLGSQYFQGGLGTIGESGRLLGSVYAGERGAATQGQGYMLQQGQQNNAAFQTGMGNIFNSALGWYAQRPQAPTLPSAPTSTPGFVPYRPTIQPNRP